jgi:hypothetical protein
MRRLRQTCASLFILLAALLVGGCGGCSQGSASVERASNATPLERHQEFAEDMQRVQRYDEGLEATLAYARTRSELFEDPDGPVELSAEERRELRQIHAAVVDQLRALDQVKVFWRGSALLSPLTDRRAHARAYLANYATSLVQYRRGLQWVDLTVPNDTLETVLDEPSPQHDLPARSFAQLKWRVIHVKEVSRLFAGYQYYKMVRDDLVASNCLNDAPCREAMDLVETHHEAASLALHRRGWFDFGYNAFDILRDAGFDAWFPVQSRVADWMGDTRIRRKNVNLISREDIARLRPELEPGDIIVTRLNWYLSNVGLPGFWPHAELYLGSPEEMEAYFDQPEVRADFRKRTGHDGLVEYLRDTHPRAWKAYTAPSADTPPHRVIEAVAEGVVFSSLYEAAGADYAAAMRPRTSKVDKARAIAAAFAHWDKPYDFNFNFLTDQEIVCTQLVYKAWRSNDTKDGVDFALAEIMGRTTLPANEMVRQFDEQYDDDDRQLDFVYFLDGRESEQTAVVGDVDDFRASWRRPKWDFAQQ